MFAAVIASQKPCEGVSFRLYLFHDSDWDVDRYCGFLSSLAQKYFSDVYLVPENLNEVNTPKPGSFDTSVLSNNELDVSLKNTNWNFEKIYGVGAEPSTGIPLFVFNYLDYLLWEKYFDELRGEKTKEGSRERISFFSSLGCGDFGLKVFEQFYFSRTGLLS